eukprot:gb/GEZN01006161.1/.p1 GENE.gb/GEZN01006161.1/~~gb/GEZN01006161.1/.p1  ORF type:complete len:342 (-),score=122.70 gb/GEZN01006161.1/:439-1464(-)
MQDADEDDEDEDEDEDGEDDDDDEEGAEEEELLRKWEAEDKEEEGEDGMKAIIRRSIANISASDSGGGVSALLAEKLLAGWTMLADHCPAPACSCPLVAKTSSSGEMLCVQCGATVVREQAFDPKKHRRVEPGQMPSTAAPATTATTTSISPSSSFISSSSSSSSLAPSSSSSSSVSAPVSSSFLDPSLLLSSSSLSSYSSFPAYSGMSNNETESAMNQEAEQDTEASSQQGPISVQREEEEGTAKRKTHPGDGLGADTKKAAKRARGPEQPYALAEAEQEQFAELDNSAKALMELMAFYRRKLREMDHEDIHASLAIAEALSKLARSLGDMMLVRRDLLQ